MARRLLPLGIAILLVGALAAPARAIGSFGPPVNIWDPVCVFDAFNVDLASDTNEVVHGFADLWGCPNSDFRIHYFEGSGTTWTLQATPYHGFVLAVAWDATGTYLLYIDFASSDLRITKRLTDGTYTGGRRLASGGALDSNLSQGDVVATGGQWWAVWREHVAPGGSPGDEFDQSDLFQAYTIGGTVHGRQRITTNPGWDSGPTLALTPATGRTVEADNGSGSFVSHTFNTPGNQNFGFGPRITIAGGEVVVGWTGGTGPRPRAFVAERVGSTWTGTFASPSSATRTQVLAGVAPGGGLATAVILSLGSRLYATNET